MRSSLSMGSYEAGILWRFFDGVSAAVSGRMVRGSPPGEENLTFLLCELLDANTTSLHALSYPLSQVQEDLATSDAGITVDVEFETHEHSKHIESKYSGADLGIVVTINHPLLGYSRRGLLVQAKRLFGKGKDREFSLFSEYDSFEMVQAEFLKLLQERFGVWNSIYYLWYNPASVAFPENEAKLLRAYEANTNDLYAYWGRFHPFMDELIDSGFPWLLNAGRPKASTSSDEEGKAREWRATQPALRISALDVVLSVAEHGTPRLKALYDTLLEVRGSSPTFSPFADFFLLMLANSRHGSDNEDWVKLAEGQKVAMPPLKPASDSHARRQRDEFDSPPIPRHTLKVTVRSTLPNVG